MASSWTQGWGIVNEGFVSAIPASGSYGVANRGVWYPIWVPTICIARRMWWANGSTVNASYNVEAGLYLDGGHKPGAKLITTGSTAQGTLNEVQFVDITDTTLYGGHLYWLYMSCSTTSATFFRSTLNTTFLPWGHFQQASIGPGSAPATATPAQGADTYVYLFGFSTTTIT